MRTTQNDPVAMNEPEAIDEARHRTRARPRTPSASTTPRSVAIQRTSATASTTARDDVHGLPDADLAHADEHLRVLRLRQRVVELPFAALPRSGASCSAGSHAWMTPPIRIWTPSTQSSSGWVQPFSSVGVRVDEREHDETGRRARAATGRSAREVDPVLQARSSRRSGGKQRDPERVHVSPPLPCSGGWRGARRAKRSRSRRGVQKTCKPSPARSSASRDRRRASRSGSRTSTGTAGSQATVCTQSGMSVSGTSRPERSSSSTM